jgi:hypothetical protein
MKLVLFTPTAAFAQHQQPVLDTLPGYVVLNDVRLWCRVDILQTIAQGKEALGQERPHFYWNYPDGTRREISEQEFIDLQMDDCVRTRSTPPASRL